MILAGVRPETKGHVMPTATSQHRDDPLRARDAQTVISPGVAVGPANEDQQEREPAAVEAAPKSYRYGIGLVALGLLAMIGIAIFVA
jgi:hypothetical protein